MIRMNQAEKDMTVVKVPLNHNKVVKSSIRWKNEGEFWYNGNLFDLVKQKTFNDTVYYYCINDKQEEKLYANLNEQIRNNSEQQNAAKSLAKIISQKSELVYFICRTEQKTENNVQIINYQELLSLYKSLVISPLSPPPKV